MSTVETEPEPSRQESLQYLIDQHEKYLFDFDTHGRHLASVSLVAVIGPSGAGKTTIVKEVTSQDSDITPMISTMTRDARPNESPYNRTNTPIEVIRQGVASRSVVQYFPSPTGEVYATFPDGFTAPITIAEIGYDAIGHLSNIPFQNFWPIVPLMAGEVYASRFGLDQIFMMNKDEGKDKIGRIEEGLGSLDFAEANAHDNSVYYIEVNNDADSLALSAKAIINITRHHTQEIMTTERRLRRINEMRAVLRAAQSHFGV